MCTRFDLSSVQGHFCIRILLCTYIWVNNCVIMLWHCISGMVQWDQAESDKNRKVGISHAAEELLYLLWRGCDGVWTEFDRGDSVFRTVYWAPHFILQRTEELLLCTPHLSGKTTQPIKQHSRYLGSHLAKHNTFNNSCPAFRFKYPLCVFCPPGVHGCFVCLHNVSFRVKECSGLWTVAHAHHFHLQTRPDKISSKPAPRSGGADPPGPIGTLRHVPTLSVWLAVPRLPWPAARGLSLSEQCCKGQWARWGAAAIGADGNHCATKQHRSGGKLKGMLTRNDATT